jgi:hypothetical protein
VFEVHTLLDSRESVVYYGSHNTIALNGILHPIQTEVDELFVSPPHQHVPTMHVPVLKLQGLYQHIKVYIDVAKIKVTGVCTYDADCMAFS